MSVNSKMTAIADEIRELSGTTEAMGLDAMASNVSEVNAEVNSQTELLTQAVLALNGKTSGGGGTTGLSVQADWNQTDETAPDFIKNKPEVGGGASSWNELTDKPVVTVGSDTLTWDGNTEGLESLEGMLFRVSDAIVTAADYANGVVYTYEGKQYEILNIIESGLNDNMAFGVAMTADSMQMGVYFIPYDNYDLDGIVFLKAGIWLSHAGSITIPGYTGFAKEQIDPAFLPAPLQFGESETGGDTLTWDGDTEGRAVCAFDPSSPYYKVSEAVLTQADLSNGASVTLSNGYTYTISASEIEVDLDAVVIGVGAMSIGENMAAEIGCETGTYFASAGAHTTSLTIPGYTGFPLITPVAEKFIPDTIQRVGDDVILNSSTAGSTKKFKLTVDDSGTITATEVT